MTINTISNTIIFLTANKGKTIEELILQLEESKKQELIHEEQLQKQLQEEKKLFINSLLKQKYFKLSHHVDNVEYIELISCKQETEPILEYNAVSFGGTFNNEYIKIEKQYLPSDRFKESFSFTKTTPITKEKYIEQRDKIKNLISEVLKSNIKQYAKQIHRKQMYYYKR